MMPIDTTRALPALLALQLLLIACATPPNPLDDYEQLTPATDLDAPAASGVAPRNAEAVARGRYLVELLGCGVCHTDGALEGSPRHELALAGSDTGIAYTNPLAFRYPGVVFPPNITPHDETGIGLWRGEDVAAAIRAGLGRHGSQRIAVMPWQSYARLSNNDVMAIVGYLQSLEPVEHLVPENTEPGQRTSERYVHFGVYRSR